MKTYKEITEALPPHLSKHFGGDTVIDRTPSFNSIEIVVPKNVIKQSVKILKTDNIKHSTSGSSSGKISFIKKSEATKAVKLLKDQGIKILISNI